MPRMSFKRIRRRWIDSCCRWVAIVVLAVTPATAMAQRGSDDDVEPYDARTEGYTAPKTLPAGGNALTWIALIFLAVVACAGLFKDAKRTHLD